MYIVFYHHPCPDGEMAKEVWNLKYPQSKYYKWNHKYTNQNYTLLNTFNNENIVFLDICPEQDKLKDNNKYIIIDHHKNAIEKLTKADNIDNNCSTEYSGCQLCWKYLFNNKEFPIAVHHIGNYDIWNFDDKDTEYFCLGYYNYDYKTLLDISIDEYNNIINIGKNIVDEYIKKANDCSRHIHTMVETINNKRILFVQLFCDDPKIYKYLIDIIKEKYPGYNVLRIVTNKNSPLKYSLRSLDGTTVDDIARHYGGNGHPMAAGYISSAINITRNPYFL